MLDTGLWQYQKSFPCSSRTSCRKVPSSCRTQTSDHSDQASSSHRVHVPERVIDLVHACKLVGAGHISSVLKWQNLQRGILGLPPLFFKMDEQAPMPSSATQQR
jgi:hypothetical protein